MAKEFEQKTKPNLLIMTDILVQGQHVPTGSVIPKSAMAKSDWQNLAFSFDPPRVVETDEGERFGPEVDEPAADALTTSKLPVVK